LQAKQSNLASNQINKLEIASGLKALRNDIKKDFSVAFLVGIYMEGLIIA